MDAIPLKSKEAKYVASKLGNKFISIFFCRCDLGSNFEYKIFQEVYKLLGIDKTRTTVRRPQSSRELIDLSRTWSHHTFDKQDNWEEYIPLLMPVY